MGLDMWLSVRGYTTDEELKEKVCEHFKWPKNSKNLDICLMLCHWKNEFALHEYFVNLESSDNDSRMWVSMEELQYLVNLCDDVLAQPDSAKELLPIPSGYLPHGYNEHYFECLKDTSAQLKEIIKAYGDDEVLVYEWSW